MSSSFVKSHHLPVSYWDLYHCVFHHSFLLIHIWNDFCFFFVHIRFKIALNVSCSGFNIWDVAQLEVTNTEVPPYRKRERLCRNNLCIPRQPQILHSEDSNWITCLLPKFSQWTLRLSDEHNCTRRGSANPEYKRNKLRNLVQQEGGVEKRTSEVGPVALKALYMQKAV